MTIPYPDPSNPALPSPLFSDLTAVRADHMRANNAAIFGDLAVLDERNPAAVVLSNGSFKTAALANADTYTGRSLFLCAAGVSDTPYAAVWRVVGFWDSGSSSGRFVAMLNSSLETWEINYSGAAWGVWTKHTDSNDNHFASVFVDGYNTTETSGGNLTLTNASASNQRFTGSSNHTVTLPVTSTLALGWAFSIINAGTGIITINSSGGNLVATVPSMITRQILCVLTSGTAAASWFVANDPSISTGTLSPIDGLLKAAGGYVAQAVADADYQIPLQVLVVQDQQSSGTNAGTFTSGAWRTRVLNTVVSNSISGASLASNQITLPAGRYLITALAPAERVTGHKAILYNVTDAAVSLLGSSENPTSTVSTSSKSEIRGVITIAAQKVFELRHYCMLTVSTHGLGAAASIPSTDEVYAQVTIVKL